MVIRLEIKCFDMGTSNTYVVWNASSLRAAIIDCGNPISVVKSFITANELKVEYIILTHGHFDHADGIFAYKEAFPNARTICTEAEACVLSDPSANLSAYFCKEAVSYPLPDIALHDGDDVVIHGDIAENDIIFKTISASGHTSGSYVLYCEKERVMFSGDVIFAGGGRGRTDFKYGDEIAMQKTLQKLYSIPESFVFYPGHGECDRI